MYSFISDMKSSNGNSLTSPVCLSRTLKFSEFASFCPITSMYCIHSFSASLILLPMLSFLSSTSTRTSFLDILSANFSLNSKNNSDFVEIKVDKPRKPSQKKGLEVSVDDDGFCHFKGDLKSLLKIARMLGDEA